VPAASTLATPTPTAPTTVSEDPTVGAQERGQSHSKHDLQPAANELRKMKKRHTFVDLSHVDDPSDENLSEESAFEHDAKQDNGPESPASSRLVLKALKVQRVQKKKTDENMMRKSAEERGKRFLEYRQQKEQQQCAKRQKFDVPQQEAQHPYDQQADNGATQPEQSEDGPQPAVWPQSQQVDMQPEYHDQVPNQSDNTAQRSALDDPPTQRWQIEAALTPEQQAAIARMIAFADSLQDLSSTIRAAARVLPVAYIEGLNDELGNDWAIDEMKTMVDGVVKIYSFGGKRGWKAGDNHPRWNSSTSTSKQE